jgi:hypothetical protein
VTDSISDPPPSLRFLGTTIYTRGRWQKWVRVADTSQTYL